MSGLVGFLLALALVAVIGAFAFAFGLFPTQVGGPGVAATSSPGVEATTGPVASASTEPSISATLEPSPSSPPLFTLAPPSPGGTYVVQPGDSLFTIAEQFGIPMQLIIDANGITNPDHIEVGQVLIIPIAVPATAGAASYIVQGGDTVTSIAVAFGVDPTDLADFNNIADWNDIKIGDVLYIPGPGWTPRPVEE